MRRLDPGYDKGRFATSQLGLAAVARARALDDWARSFLADHRDAVVLHLGCGLDARVYRIDPPATVDTNSRPHPRKLPRAEPGHPAVRAGTAHLRRRDRGGLPDRAPALFIHGRRDDFCSPVTGCSGGCEHDRDGRDGRPVPGLA